MQVRSEGAGRNVTGVFGRGARREGCGELCGDPGRGQMQVIEGGRATYFGGGDGEVSELRHCRVKSDKS